jgi:hypothetical protein
LPATGVEELNIKFDDFITAFKRGTNLGKAGSTTHVQVWAEHEKNGKIYRGSLASFFSSLGFKQTSENVPKLPKPLESKFQREQQTALFDGTTQYEVQVTQPTFMNAIALAAGIDGVKEWNSAANVPKLQEVQLPNNRVLRMFTGSQCWIGDRLSPDFGLFVKGYQESQFSALLIGEADNKESVKAKSLTNNHKGENLIYQYEVLRLCPFRQDSANFVYSFLTNNRRIQFLRSKVTGVDDVGAIIVENETTDEVDMEIGWPFLWQLLNASPSDLGHSLPSVHIGDNEILLDSVIGIGAQGVCYAGTFEKQQVVIKLSKNIGELYQERRVLGTLRKNSVIISSATVKVNGSAVGSGVILPTLCDGMQALSETAQQFIPSVVAYGPGVLVMGSVGKPFDEGTSNACWCAVLHAYSHSLKRTYNSRSRPVRRACQAAAGTPRPAPGARRFPHGHMPSPPDVSPQRRAARHRLGVCDHEWGPGFDAIIR